MFLAYDGVRALFRSQQDKLQTGSSFPLSYNLKEQFEDINFAQISKARAVFFDNKYFLALPTGASTSNDSVWVYYPATQSWVVNDGWAVADWAKIKFSGGEERLHYIDNADDVVYRAWTGYDDNKRTFTASMVPNPTATENNSTITSTVGTFLSSDVGKDFIFSDNSVWTIISYTDANNIVVSTRGTKISQSGSIGAIDYVEEGRKEDFGKPLITKSGGEVRIKALAVGNYDLTVSAEIDDKGYTTLGTMNLSSGGPTLPIALPFTLAAENIKEQVFHLDSLGPFRQIRLKIQHNATNGSDDIKIYERTIVTYADEYQSEQTVS